MLSVLALLALAALSHASSSTSNYGLDDDDTDDTDNAGRYAHNHANNIVELAQRKIDKAVKLCEPWPKSEFEACHRNVVRCVFASLVEGEFADHIKMDLECDDRDNDAARSAYGDRREIYLLAYNKGKVAKRLCNREDGTSGDRCKHNVECRLLAGAATAFPTILELEDCDLDRDGDDDTNADTNLDNTTEGDRK